MNADTPCHRSWQESPLARTTDYGRALLRMARFAMGMFAVQVAALVGVSVTLATDPDRGVTAGLVTLVICWTLLVLGELAWRRRLNRRDQRDWADGWARVEPQWSERPT